MSLYSSHNPLPTGRYTYVGSYRSPLTPPSRRRSEVPTRHRVRAAYGVIAVLAVMGSYIGWNQHASAHQLAVSRQHQQELVARAQRVAAAQPQVDQLIAADPQVTFSISAQEVDADAPADALTSGTNGLYDAASIGKLVTAGDLLHRVDANSMSLNQALDGRTLGQWLQPMIVDSDDTAWAELNDYLTHAGLTRYARTAGITDYDATNNELSATDVTSFLGRLWQGKLLSPTSQKILLDYMARANYRQYIVPAITGDETVYHKVGIDGDEVNDAAIITHGDQAVALTIMTNGNGTYDWADRAQIIQQITKVVTNAYF